MGAFTWLSPQGTRLDLVGVPAGTVDPEGYVYIKVRQIRYRAHRLAWFYMTGQWPTNLIDHMDGIRSNNRWLNLREATPRLNNENQRKSTSSNLWTNYLGVSFHRASGKYEANIGVSENGKKRKLYLGLFETDALAHAAYVTAKRKHHLGNTLITS